MPAQEAAGGGRLLKRLAQVEITAAKPGEAAAAYARNFGFRIRESAGGATIVEVGAVELRLVAPPESGSPGSAREGLAALWLEADDLGAVADVLRAKGISVAPPRTATGIRILKIPPTATGNVPLFVFDRRLS